MSTTTIARPRTSKPRGICAYYKTQRGCFAGKTCKFMHGDLTDEDALTPFDQAKTCKYFAKGFCTRGDKCWFSHVKTGSTPSKTLQTDEDVCCICLERPIVYGLLAGCNHVFCLECIRHWRTPKEKTLDVVMSGVHKQCPLCRAGSNFVTPSSVFATEEQDGKDILTRQYKNSMNRSECRYFKLTLATDVSPFCPFGKDCFYKHVNTDGTPFIFEKGVKDCIRMHAARQRRQTAGDNPLPFTRPPFFPRTLDILNMIFGNSVDNLHIAIRAQLTNNSIVDALQADSAEAIERATQPPHDDAITPSDTEQMIATIETMQTLLREHERHVTTALNDIQGTPDSVSISTESPVLTHSTNTTMSTTETTVTTTISTSITTFERRSRRRGDPSSSSASASTSLINGGRSTSFTIPPQENIPESAEPQQNSTSSSSRFSNHVSRGRVIPDFALRSHPRVSPSEDERLVAWEDTPLPAPPPPPVARIMRLADGRPEDQLPLDSLIEWADEVESLNLCSDEMLPPPEDEHLDPDFDPPFDSNSSTEIRPEPPFMTDGRGRVVWSSNGSNPSSSQDL